MVALLRKNFGHLMFALPLRRGRDPPSAWLDPQRVSGNASVEWELALTDEQAMTRGGGSAAGRSLGHRHRKWVARAGTVMVLVAVLGGPWRPTDSRAGALPVPTGEVLLVVTGNIGNTNVGGEARFDRQMLEALGTSRLVTRTPWHPDGNVFEGVRADRLLKAVEARGEAVRATAANDYRVTIPLSDFAAHDVLLAMRIDGRDLTLRTKGPIWVIYPDDADLPEGERSERMIWQLVQFDVE